MKKSWKLLLIIFSLLFLGAVSAQKVSAASCDVTITPSWFITFPIVDKDPYTFEAQVSNVEGGIFQRVEFSFDDPNIFTLTCEDMAPCRDSTLPYTSQIVTQAEGIAILTANVIIDGAVACSDSQDLAVYQCPFTSNPPNRFVVDIALSRLIQKLIVNDLPAASDRFTIGPRNFAGLDSAQNYDITLVGYDDHALQGNPAQTDENWKAHFYTSGGVDILTTAPTADLPDGSDYITTQVATNVNLGVANGTIIAEHSRWPALTYPYPDDSSIHPVCAVLDIASGNSCEISINNVPLSGPGDTASVIATPQNEVGGSVKSVTFSSADPAIAAFIPVTPADWSFNTTITAVSLGSTTYTVTGTMDDGVTTCTSLPANINVSDTPAWWQVKDGDVVSEANINSTIPASCSGSANCNAVIVSAFDVTPAPITRGIPIANSSVGYGSGDGANTDNSYVENASVSTSALTVSDLKGKLPSGAITDISGSNLIDEAQIAGGGMASPAGSQYYYFSYDGSVFGDLRFDDALNIIDRKVIVFVQNADVYIEADININDGFGGFYLFSGGDIYIDSNVGGPQEESPCVLGCTPDLEGFFFTEGIFTTETNGPDLDEQLHLRGAVVANEIDLNRNLVNDAETPGELFEFAADLLMQFPAYLGTRSILWKEVAP